MPSSRPQRLRARIRLRRPNPYVDVPGRVGRAFARFARAGRIRVVGTLDGAAIRGTLVPVRGGGHRLHVNGGMRAAAGVEPGDVALFVLRATRAEEVALPADLARRLRAAPLAARALERLAPSQQRELVRYVDDARTRTAQERRVERTIEHLLGRTAKRARGAGKLARRPLWTCPRCGNAFVNRNQWHSCARHDIAEPFRGKPPRIRALYERFRALVEACGPVKVLPYRDRIGFMVRVRFAGATPRRDWLDVGFWLPRRLSSRRFLRVETIYPHVHLHRVRIREPRELDRELARWLRQAYAVGCQEHLKG